MRHFCLLAIALLLLTIVPACSAQSKAAAKPSGPTVVYVAIGGEKHVAVYDVDAATGKLKEKQRLELDGAPGPLAVSPDKKRLYAGLRPTKSIQTLAINPDGTLKPIATTPVDLNPVYVAIDKSGKFALTGDYGGNVVAVHPLKADGSLEATPSSRLETGKNPHSINSDASNRFVFVPLCGVDQVLQYKLEGGKLVPNSPAAVNAQPVDGPRHFTFHPSGKYVFVCNEKSSTAASYKLNANGTLTPIDKQSTLPAGVDAKAIRNTTADTHVTPDGKYLYVSNRGHHSLAGFRIDAATGKLTPIGHTPTEATPREFEITPDGRFVYSAGQASGKLAAYRLDSANGALQPIEVYEVGKGPAWVLAVQ